MGGPLWLRTASPASLRRVSSPPTLPTAPTRPHPDECCRRGCEPCIFDYYDRALERWSDRVRALGADPEALLRQAGDPPPR